MTFPQAPRFFQPPHAHQLVVHGDRRYQVGQALGSGAYGTVYECGDEWGNFLVAKVLPPMQGESFRQVQARWADEAGKLMALRHPNVTYIHDAFEYNGTFYLIIERCSYDLNQLIGSPQVDGAGWLPWIASQVLQGVDFIHRSGYVHKDLHPGNIFIAWQHDPIAPTMAPTQNTVFRAKIGDLGIARLAHEIRPNSIMAPWLLPPEHLDPRYGPVGPGVDIYHSALCFLALVMGGPLSFTQPQILAAVPRDTAFSLGAPLGPVLARALEPTVANRTPTPLQFWRELDDALRPRW